MIEPGGILSIARALTSTNGTYIEAGVDGPLVVRDELSSSAAVRRVILDRAPTPDHSAGEQW